MAKRAEAPNGVSPELYPAPHSGPNTRKYWAASPPIQVQQSFKYGSQQSVGLVKDLARNSLSANDTTTFVKRTLLISLTDWVSSFCTGNGVSKQVKTFYLTV